MNGNHNSTKRNFGWRSSVFLFAVITVAIVFQPSSAAQTSATIEGVVLDAANDRPLAEVQVWLLATDASPFASAITNAQGHFAIETTQSGRLRVLPTLNGYIYSFPRQMHAAMEPGLWVQVSSGKHIQDLELRLARPASISGRVLKSDGQPLVGVWGTVTVNHYTYGTDGKRSLRYIPGVSYPTPPGGSSRRPDDHGEFRLYNLPPGEYYLTVSSAPEAIGTSNNYFYPGTMDESKAIPIHVNGGDDIEIGTLSLPRPSNGTNVTLHLKNSKSGGTSAVYIGGMMFSPFASKIPNEIVLPPLVQGHYDIVLKTMRGPNEIQYATVPLDVGGAEIEKEVELKPGATVTATLLMENASGKRSVAPASIRCLLRSDYGLYNCTGAQVVPSDHEIELDGLPADYYVLSMKADDRDVLASGLNIIGDTNLEIVLGSNGGIAQGTVRDSAGNTLPDAVVAVVPDAPYRSTGLLYRSVISDPNGKFEIHGIAPGSYKLFAWGELEGAGYRNADFMKEFDERGTPAQVGKDSKLSIDLTAF